MSRSDSAPGRVWLCGERVIDLARTLVMGILNVTPDSFSDGGLYDAPGAALTRARTLIAAGAHVIDVGGESTRPGSRAIDPAEELARVRPVIARLAQDASGAVSVDTRNAVVARACVEAGASIINDVSGFRDPEMVEVAASCSVGLVVMHMLGEPGTMQDDPHYDDVVTEVGAYLEARARVLEEAGVARERIAIDPGIGFGKTLEHNLELLGRLEELAMLGYPVVVGASRKRFIGAITGQEDPSLRLEGSLAAAMWAAMHGADVVRVHDVAETVRALKVAEAIRGYSV